MRPTRCRTPLDRLPKPPENRNRRFSIPYEREEYRRLRMILAVTRLILPNCIAFTHRTRTTFNSNVKKPHQTPIRTHFWKRRSSFWNGKSLDWSGWKPTFEKTVTTGERKRPRFGGCSLTRTPRRQPRMNPASGKSCFGGNEERLEFQKRQKRPTPTKGGAFALSLRAVIGFPACTALTA